jgi:hypothetical protein
MLNHPWLTQESNYDTKLSPEEIEQRKTKPDFDEDEIKIETSKLIDSDIE